MNRRSTVLGATIAAAALALAACGSAASPAATPSSTASSASTAPSSASTSTGSSSASSSSSSSSSGASASASEVVGTAAPSSAPIKIGSANFPEAVLIGEIYANVLEGKGITVERKLNLGNRELYIPALLDGSIDMIPEYTGNLLQYFDKASTASTSADVFAALPKALPAGFMVLNQSAAEDKDTITVTKETAAKYNLKSIADLAPVAKDLAFGGPAEIESRKSGLVGFKSVYGVEFGDFRTLDTGGPLTVSALDTGQIDAGDLFTTDPTIGQKGWVVLEDPKSVFTAQNVLPLANSAKVTPEAAIALNAVSGKLTTDILIELLTKVYGGQSEADVAKAWVAQAGLK